MTTTPRLPVRIDPREGEAWLGYTRRVAAYYRIPWMLLMRPVIPADPLRLRYPTSPRLSGVAATTDTLTIFAGYFRLTLTEVADMHLTRFHGSALTFTPESVAAHDPRLPAPPDHILRGQRLGRLVSPRRPRACPECLRRQPRHRELTWRLRWHYACLTHGLLIVDESTSPDRTASHPLALDTQAEILDRLTPSPVNRAFFTALDRRLTTALRRPGGRRWEGSDSHTIAAHAPQAAAQAVAYVLPGPDPMALLLAGPRVRSRTLDPAWVPPLLPRRHFVPDLADLLYPVPLRTGREIAACAALVRGARMTPADAARVAGQRTRTPYRLEQALTVLARHGRLDPFLEALDRALGDLITDRIDYAARTRAVADSAHRAELRAAALHGHPAADPWIVKSWLVEHWACTYTAGHERVTSRDGRLDRFDRDHGPALTAALRHTHQAVA